MRNNFRLSFFFIFYILFLEILSHYACFKNFNIDITNILFCIPIGILFNILCNLTKKKIINKIITFTLCIILAVIYCAQIVYFNMYESFFSLTAIMMAGQVTEGADQITTVIIHNIVTLLIAFIPIILLIITMKSWSFEKTKKREIFLLISLLLIIHGTALLTINLDKNGNNSKYQIYNNTASPITSVNKFGILTTLRLSIQKEFFGTNDTLLSGNISNPNYQENNEIKYNQIDIDWEKIIENQTNKNIKQVSTFFSNEIPSEQNEYTGIFKDKNVIFILAESLYKPAITEELTPTLYKMMTQGFNFENYYVPLYPTSTADGEYMIENSLYPVIGNAYNLYNSRKNYNPYNFVNAFKNLGYKLSAYHGYTSTYYSREEYFKNLGYDEYGFCDTSLNMRCESGFNASDLKMVQNSIDNYINEDKFFTTYITISGHGKYDYNTDFVIRQNWSSVKNLDYSNQVKGYLASTLELEKAMAELFNKLEAAGKLNDTVFVLSPDHWPYYFKPRLDELEEIAGDRIYDKFDLHKNVLMIYNNEMQESVTVNKLASSIDVLPTLLNLMGIEYDSRLLMGRDILSKSDSLVIFSDYSWITEKGKYDGEKFIPANEDIIVTDEYIEEINNRVKQKILVSSLIQKNNYYKNLFDTIKKIEKEDNSTNNNPTTSENN